MPLQAQKIPWQLRLRPVLATVADGLGFVLPKAANLTARAFIFIDEVVSLALASITVAIHKLLSLLGKLPGGFGKSFREAADVTQKFTNTLLGNVMRCEKTLDSLTTEQQAYHHACDENRTNANIRCITLHYKR